MCTCPVPSPCGEAWRTSLPTSAWAEGDSRGSATLTLHPINLPFAQRRSASVLIGYYWRGCPCARSRSSERLDSRPGFHLRLRDRDGRYPQRRIACGPFAIIAEPRQLYEERRTDARLEEDGACLSEGGSRGHDANPLASSGQVQGIAAFSGKHQRDRHLTHAKNAYNRE